MKKENGEVIDNDAALLTAAEAAELQKQLDEISPEEIRRRVAMIEEVKRIIVGHTSPTDWVLFKAAGAKPKIAYLCADGAERLAALVGASWEEPTMSREQREGSYIHIFKGYFSLGRRKVYVIGSCSSKDRFFSKKYGRQLSESEVSERDVQMKAFSNFIRNGVSRLLGLRNLDASYFGDFFFGKIPVVEFTDGGAGGTSKKQTADEERRAKEVWDYVLAAAGGNEEDARAKLKEATKFKNKSNEEVAGISDYTALTGKRLEIIHEKVLKRKAADKAAAEAKAAEEAPQQSD